MGGLRKHIPITYWMMVIGTIALTGVGIPGTIIGTAGFFSKDAIIEGAFVGHNAAAPIAFVLLTVAAMFTSFYSWRLILHDFPRKAARHRRRDAPYPRVAAVMLVPLYILAVGALAAGVVFHDFSSATATRNSGRARSSRCPAMKSSRSSTTFRSG